jgi:hypothetical protein
MSQDQRSCFETGLKIIAVVMVIGLVLCMPLALAGRSFGRVFFRPAILSAVLRNSVIGSGALEGLIKGNVLSRELFDTISGEEEQIRRYFDYLSPGEREEIILALIPPDWIENQFTQVLQDFFEWLDDDRPVPKLVLDLAPLKANLLGGGINTFVDIVIDSWPSCKQEQVEQLQRSFFESGQLLKDLCEPPEPLRSRVVDLASIGFEKQVRQIPESILLVETDAPGDDFLAMKEQLRFFRALSLWGWMLPLSLLGLIMAFAIRTWKDFGRWWGIPLLLGGVGTLFVALILSALREDLLVAWSSGIINAGPLQDIFKTGLDALYGAGLRTIWLQGFSVVIIGFVLWYLSRRTRGKPVKMEEPIPEEIPSAVTQIDAPTHQELEIDEEGEPPAGIFG